MLMVPEHEWCLLLGENRRTRLLAPPSPDHLLERVVKAAEQSASNGRAQIVWRPADKKPGFCRIQIVIPVPEDVFDWLFNGPSGYRAQYYLSPGVGEQYNRSIVDGLAEAVIRAVDKGATLPVCLGLAKQSLFGHHSKIWVFGDWAAFLHEPNVLLPRRWVEYWATTQDEPFGLKAPLPTFPAIDLKATFIRPETGEEWLDAEKADRSEKIFRTGWT